MGGKPKDGLEGWRAPTYGFVHGCLCMVLGMTIIPMLFCRFGQGDYGYVII